MKIIKYVEHSLLVAIGSSYDLIWRGLNAQVKKEGCSLLQAMILIAIFFEKSDFIVRPSLLAKIFRTTRGNVSHCISFLEKKGLLKRVLDERDARSYQLRLQPNGKKAAIRLMKVLDELEGHFDKKIGKETVQTLIEGLKSVQTTYLDKKKNPSHRALKTLNS